MLVLLVPLPTPSNAKGGAIRQAFRQLFQMKEFWMDILSARAAERPQPSPSSTVILSLDLQREWRMLCVISSSGGCAKFHAEPRRRGSILGDLQFHGALSCVFACVCRGCLCKLRTGIGLCQCVERLAVQAVCLWAGSSCRTRRDWCYCHNHVRTCTRA